MILTVNTAPAITTQQLTYRHGFITNARFAADGVTVIYSAAFEGKPVELFSTTLEGPPPSNRAAWALTTSSV